MKYWDVEYGYYTPSSNFLNERLFSNRNNEETTQKLFDMIMQNNPSRAIKLSLINESVGTGKLGRMEIYTDENSENLLKQSMKNLQDQLEFKLDISKTEFPKKLENTFWQINLLIVL